mmetsp:Transcript_1178/g.1097  ORF Transcript_1178/g.1097 Transcript_1178/m.1097 type:complete len:81 (+) Transcript_1178:552-794(+)
MMSRLVHFNEENHRDFEKNSRKKINLNNIHERKYPIVNPLQMANSIVDPQTGNSLEYRHIIKNDKTRDIWNKSFANELGI